MRTSRSINSTALLCLTLSFFLSVDSPPAPAQSTQPSAQQQKDPEYWFAQAEDLAAEKEYDQALAALKKVIELDPRNARAYSAAGQMLMQMDSSADAIAFLQHAVKLDPKNPIALQNLGQACQNAGKPEESNQAYQALLQLEPENWRARAKLVQNFQTLGKLEERDRERDKLLAMNKDGKVDQSLFCREQFKVGEQKVMAMEYFELAGDWAKRYVFFVLDAKTGKTAYRVSLGSYALTNEVSHQSGELKPDERSFHLDGYYPNEHRTFAFFNNEPSYDETRKLVVEVIEGKRHAISSTKGPNTDR